MASFGFKKAIIAVLAAAVIAPSGYFAGTGLLADGREIIFATTTSTQDTGLLDVLVPIFQKQTGYFVKVIAVGSGQAMALGERGEADVLLVHSPDAEKKFVDGGFGVNRRIVMHNDFVILGPAADPAKIRGLKSASLAFKSIARSNALFMSRGDRSGTHVKELKLWQESGAGPEKGKWYQETGLGMGHTLNVSSEKQAYTISDRSTYLSLKKNLQLSVLLEGDPALFNVYHIIEVNPDKWKSVNAEGARAFSNFFVSRDTQKIIGDFGREKFGTPLFYPDAVK